MRNDSPANPFFFSRSSIHNIHLNETDLHNLIYANRESELESFINQHGEDAVSQMAQTYDDLGALPLDLLDLMRSPTVDLIPIKERLIELGTRFVKPLFVPFDSTEILARYVAKKDESLNQLLTIACEIGNQVRQTINSSSTHPQTNAYSDTDKNLLHEAMKNDEFENIVGINPENWEASVRRKKESRQANDIGCCKLAIHALREQHPETNAQLLKLTQNNRTFLIMEKERGDDAVILDPWAGVICLYNERYALLSDYRRIDTPAGYINMLTRINPRHNQFQLANKTHQNIGDIAYYLCVICWFLYIGCTVFNEITSSADNCPAEPEPIVPLFHF